MVKPPPNATRFLEFFQIPQTFPLDNKQKKTTIQACNLTWQSIGDGGVTGKAGRA
jgi:hypothetical protein